MWACLIYVSNYAHNVCRSHYLYNWSTPFFRIVFRSIDLLFIHQSNKHMYEGQIIYDGTKGDYHEHIKKIQIPGNRCKNE
jgi:hypothetical protein